jgi:hypothetical protein
LSDLLVDDNCRSKLIRGHPKVRSNRWRAGVRPPKWTSSRSGT